MKPLVSIIVPVYNTGEILGETIKSILNQTYPNLELIIVDDGSTDHSGELCDRFAEEDPRIIVVHKKNGGRCAARNHGIDIARGSYITFCDHDDIFAPDLLETELNLLAQHPTAEIAVVGALHIYDNGKSLLVGQDLVASTKAELKKYTTRILKDGMFATVWNVLYRKELVADIRFDPDIRRGHEDVLFNIEVFRKATSFVSVKKPLYHHYIRSAMSESASFPRDAVFALQKANDSICALCSESITEIGRGEYIDLQGEYIRVFATYLVHLGMQYEEFDAAMRKLQYLSQNITLNTLARNMNKNVLSFYCLEHKKLKWLYRLIKIRNLSKGKHS